MEPLYRVTVNIKAPKGMLEIGTYYLGAEKAFAESLFKKLEGDKDLAHHPGIRLDLVSFQGKSIPLCLEQIGCDLQQYTRNCEMLAREIFKHFMFNGH